MAFKTLFKFGVPFSFVYCTIYQQNIWREGDQMLVEEQKKTWRKFFSFVDQGVNTALLKLNLSNQEPGKEHSLVGKFDTLDLKRCWNTKVEATFAAIDQAVSNPKILLCKAYRKLQSFSSTSTEAKTKDDKSSH